MAGRRCCSSRRWRRSRSCSRVTPRRSPPRSRRLPPSRRRPTTRSPSPSSRRWRPRIAVAAAACSAPARTRSSPPPSSSRRRRRRPTRRPTRRRTDRRPTARRPAPTGPVRAPTTRSRWSTPAGSLIDPLRRRRRRRAAQDGPAQAGSRCPTTRRPLIVYLGLTKNGKKAKFLVDDAARGHGRRHLQAASEQLRDDRARRRRDRVLRRDRPRDGRRPRARTSSISSRSTASPKGVHALRRGSHGAAAESAFVGFPACRCASSPPGSPTARASPASSRACPRASSSTLPRSIATWLAASSAMAAAAG